MRKGCPKKSKISVLKAMGEAFFFDEYNKSSIQKQSIEREKHNFCYLNDCQYALTYNKL